SVTKNKKKLGRRDKVLFAVDRDGKGLEIGPSFNPLAPKSEGFNVEIVDHLDQPGLIEKYRQLACPTDRIEPVDYVWRGESYADLTAKPNHYDWIIASHVIEHTPDLVGFLKSCEGVLAEGGALSLIVPDLRFCFDAMRPFSGLGGILDAHLQRRTQPSAGTATESELYMVTRGGEITWNGRNEREFALMYPKERGCQSFKRMQSSVEYEDFHVWCFTPSSFRLLMHDLRMLGLTELQEVAFFPTKDFEFFVTLKRAAHIQVQPQPVDRLQLLSSIQRELREQPSSWERWRRRVKRKLKALRT
ncbi:MAG: methyltransferase domain-containing protein, partial [Spongiibacteraceae bacterium]